MKYLPCIPGRARENVDMKVYNKDVGTAGSVTLALQAALPVVLMEWPSTSVELVLAGGTNVAHSPPVDHFTHVLLPLLRHMGIDVSVKELRRGYFPVGQGKLRLQTSRQVGMLAPLCLEEPGLVIGVGGAVFGEGPAVTAALKQELQNRVGEMVVAALAARPARVQGGGLPGGEWVTFHDQVGGCGEGGERVGGKNKRKRPKDSTLGVQLWLRTSTGAVLSANATECLKDADAFQTHVPLRLTEDVERRMSLVLDSGACVDEHTADQLVVYMALAGGESTLLCAPRDPQESTLHVESAVDIVQKITNREFSVSVVDSSCRLIRCRGISYQHPS